MDVCEGVVCNGPAPQDIPSFGTLQSTQVRNDPTTKWVQVVPLTRGVVLGMRPAIYAPKGALRLRVQGCHGP